MRFESTKGPQRFSLSAEAQIKIAPYIDLLREDRRRRPLYFDGRFLAARDLTREQDYFLARQADLGRAGGFGVVTGLVAARDGTRVRLEAGHGVTPSGELVVLSEAMTLDVAQVQVSDAVRARVGVVRSREPAGRTRSGLFILALRPIEYEANPIAQYPTTLDGERAVRNGDIVEASAVTLIPYPDLGEPTELRFRRSHAAKEIFVDRVRAGFVTDALPIAMVALDRGTLLWVDTHLVRREIGAEAGDILGVTGAPLALREAHMLQYAEHLRDVLATVHGGIVASQHFLTLPAAGPMPKSAIDRQQFAQRFFPAEIDVDLSLVPADELGALLEEARLLPPIDLTDAEELRSTSVLVVVPIERASLDPSRARLLGSRRKLPPAAPNLLAKKRPLERLALLPLLRQELRPWIPTIEPEDLAWRDLLDLEHANDLVWFVRRRNFSRKSEIVGEIVEAEPVAELTRLATRLAPFGVTGQDTHRVQPLAWKAASKTLLELEKRAPMIAAAALVEASQAPLLERDAEIKQWAEVLAARFQTRPENQAPLVDFFKAHPFAAAVLVRAGIVPELIVPFLALQKQPNRLAKWTAQVDEIEKSNEGVPARTSRIRSLIFALLDVQERDL